MTSIHFLDPNSAGKPAVLLLHGLGADSTSWTLQLPALAQAGFRPLAVDLPGFGRSPYDGRGWSIRRMAVHLADLLEELQTGPVHVVGLSMGGVVAQQFAHDFSQLTRALVLVSTFAVLRPETLEGWGYFIQRAAVVLLLGMKTQARLVAKRLFPAPRDERLRQMFISIVSRADPRAYRRAMFSLGLFDSRRWLKELNKPTLVITGAQDTTVSPGRQRLLAEAIPGARQVIVEDAGHAVSVDQPEAFNCLLIEFLQANDVDFTAGGG